jgi:flagellar hook-associated protein 3 FlgL
MVTRVATFSNQQQLISQLMVNQSRIDASQQQVSTGKRAPDYQGLGADAEALLSAKSMLATADQYLSDAKRMQNVTDQHALALQQQRQVGNDLLSYLNSATTALTGTNVMTAVDAALSSTIRTLNSTVDGKYIFGGTRTDQPPVTIGNSTHLLALGSLSGAFQNSSTKLSLQVDQGQTLTYGELADQVGTQYLQVLKNIYEYNAGTYAGPGGPGAPLTGNLSQAQISFLKSQISQLQTINSDMIDRAVVAGTAQKQVDLVVSRLESQQTATKALVSDIEDVDSAAAISNLNRDQLALQMTYKVASQINSRTLLDFL